MNNYINSFTFIMVSFVIYLFGKFFNTILNDVEGNKFKFSDLFFSFFYGLYFVIILTAFYTMLGRTSFCFLLIPILYYTLTKIRIFEKIKLLKYKFAKLELIYLMSVMFILFWCSYKLMSYYGLKGNIFILPDMDLIFYGDLGKYLINSKIEDVHMPFFNEKYTMAPYHYADIYFNIFLSKSLNCSIYLSYRVYLYSFTVIVIIIGLSSILNKNINIILALLMSVIVLLISFYSIYLSVLPYGLSMSNFLIFPKLCFSTLFLLASYLLFLERSYKKSLFILNSLSIMYSNLIFAVLLLNIFYMFWLYRKQYINNIDLLVYLSMYIVFFTYVYINHIKVYKIKSMDLDFTLFNKMILDQEISIWSSFIIFAIISSFLLKENKVFLGIVFLLLLGIFPFLFHNIDSIQLFTNFCWSIFPICIVILLGHTYLYKYKMFFFMFLLCFIIRKYNDFPTLAGVYVNIDKENKYKIDKYLTSSRNINAVFIRDSSSYNSMPCLFNSNFYRMGYWVNAVNNNNIRFLCVYDIDAYNKFDNSKRSIFEKLYYNSSCNNNFVKYSQNHNVKSVLDSFLVNNKIEMVLMDSTSKVIFNNDLIVDSIINSINKERLYILKL